MVEKILAFMVLGVLGLAVLTGTGVYLLTGKNLQDFNQTTPKVDDWQYSSGGILENLGGVAVPLGGVKQAAYAPGAPMTDGTIGLSVGGSKDINNFRDNVENNYLPINTDVTYEGLFYDYYFDTGRQEQCQDLFCPSYSYAVSKDPFSQETEYFMTVGLNSGIKESDFQRKKLNVVVVLDISGSMSSPFNKYYYDQFGNQQLVEDYEEGDEEKTKMQVANEAVVLLLDHLEQDDRFGMVLFESQAHLAKPLRPVGETDLQSIKDHVLEITPRGGTRMEAGMKMGTELFDELSQEDFDSSEYENRIIFLTDAMPNLGDTSEEGLGGIIENNAENGVYSTFIGIGVDFNTEIIESLTKVRGANYYSVHSNSQFKERMDEGFDYMVTPLVFDLELVLESQGYEIEKVYGSPEADEATGTLMKVNTLFPSSTEEGQTKGGVVLLKLKKTSPEGSLKLKVSYEDRQGKAYSSQKQVVFEQQEPEFFQNTGIRKAVVLTRYADLVKNWIIDERESLSNDQPIIQPRVDEETGIIVPEPPLLGEWERQSSPLKVSEHYQGLFQEFKKHFEKEMNELGDDAMQQEADILDKLSAYTS
jgi:Ca-activated chloride channel family protein